MVTLNQTPAAVEGAQLSVCGQKIRPNGRPNRLANSREIVYPLRVDIRGEAEIEEQKDRRAPNFKPYSLLDVGDKIAGRVLWGFASDPIGPGDIIVGGRGRTSSHSGQELVIYGTCFVELIEGWLGLPLGIHPRQELLE